jgi:hypothetical protein
MLIVNVNVSTGGVTLLGWRLPLVERVEHARCTIGDLVDVVGPAANGSVPKSSKEIRKSVRRFFPESCT